METLKQILSVAVYVVLSGALVYAIVRGAQNVRAAWRTKRWKNVAFTLAVFAAAMAVFAWAGLFRVLADTARFFLHLAGV